MPTSQQEADELLAEHQSQRKSRSRQRIVNTANYKQKLNKWRTELLLIVQHIDDALARIEA